MDGSLQPESGRFHWSPNHPLCPLCGGDLGLAPAPEKPCQTLEALTRHFESECPSTERLASIRRRA